MPHRSPTQIALNPPPSTGSQPNSHGDSVRQSQLAGWQSSGSGRHSYLAGNSPTPATSIRQNCDFGSQKMNPHWNSPSGGSQSIASPTSTPTACASHSFGYTFPSHPHTGKKMSSHPCGRGLHSLGNSGSSHRWTGESHHSSGPHPPSHADPPPPVVGPPGPAEVADVLVVLVASVVVTGPPDPDAVPVGSVAPALVVPALTPSVVDPPEVDPTVDPVVSSPFSPQAAATTNSIK